MLLVLTNPCYYFCLLFVFFFWVLLVLWCCSIAVFVLTNPWYYFCLITMKSVRIGVILTQFLLGLIYNSRSKSDYIWKCFHMSCTLYKCFLVFLRSSIPVYSVYIPSESHCITLFNSNKTTTPLRRVCLGINFI